jgi:CxxC-x17-CxxC domain-containing protein
MLYPSRPIQRVAADQPWPEEQHRPYRPGRAMEVRGRVYADKTISCRDCGMDFVFSAGEQQFYAEKGLVNEPQRCPSCRAVAKQNRALGISSGGGSGQREMHAAVCAECGGQALVPFLPRNDRPVYCSSCFDKVRAMRT